VFRIECQYINSAALASGLLDQTGTATVQLTIDLPGTSSPGGADRLDAAKVLLARILGFLSENATGAPDFDFSSNENVLRFLDGEP
jgi:hypothetical protein